ncbi:integrase [Anaerobacillus alkalidiazotrophicus]|uniref:Integrase n=1 Tax=Anaerobacillus alkalidiazotrophicus TaxID=472963 RepID=A0A1S2M3J8_9BACI|nr:tyrosine-type recombinase/integrase [Anaerobacillus alkalidiazotrophicus]OIJ19268.1 integrase [Anaerobacillus alkalidiazotrophicus]
MSLFARLNAIRSEEKNTNNFQHEALKNEYNRIEHLPFFIQDYLISRITLGYSKATIQRYIYDFCDFFTYVMKQTESKLEDIIQLPLEDFLKLETSSVQLYVSYLSLEVENEARTINRKLSALQSLFDYFIEIEKTTTNPVTNVNRPKIGKREPIFLTQREVRQLLDYIKTEQPEKNLRKRLYHEKLKHRDYLVFYLLTSTGLRISELSALKMKDIQFERQTLTVRGKGNKERTIPLTSETIKTIQFYLHSLPPSSRRETSRASLIIGYDFKTNSYTESVTLSALQKMIQRTIERAKSHVPILRDKPITAHKLRHTFATALIENGVDVLTVQSLLGHESVATTQVYAHVQDHTRKQAIERLSFSL